MPATLLVLPLIVLGLVFLVLLFGSLWLVRQAIYPRHFTYEKSYLLEVEHGRLNEADYQSWEKQEITFRSPFGYALSGTWFPIPGALKTIIMVHGFSYTRLGMVKYMPWFRRQGWNILIYDQRFYGRSGGPNTTFGYYEKQDLKAVFDWVQNQVPSASTIGTLGESLGAATCLMHAAIDPRPTFVIADSSFASLLDELKFRLKTDYNLPAFPLINLSLPLIQLLAGFDPASVSPEQDIASLDLPILFIHGVADREVPPSHSRRLFAAKQHGLRRLLLVPEAGHVESIWTDRDAYETELETFFREADI